MQFIGFIHNCSCDLDYSTKAVRYVHFVGAIEVSIATMFKNDRSKNDEVYVCGFVPKHLLPKKRPNALDPFIHPLIEEIKDLFIDGNKVVLCEYVHACLSSYVHIRY